MNVLRKIVLLVMMLAAGVAAAQTPVVGLPAGRVDGDVQINGELNRRSAVLHAFGDSITAGGSISNANARWVNLVSAAKGWTAVNHGIGGAGLPRSAEEAYGVTVDASTVSTFLVGQNDAMPMVLATNGAYNWFHGLLGSYLWLLTPSKILANSASVTKTGTWVASDLVSFGIKSSVDNSTAQFKGIGTACYVVAHGTNANASSFKVTIDGVDYGPYVAANNYADGSKYDIPWAVRVAGLKNTEHTVTVTLVSNGGTSLYLDYFACNANQVSRTGPFVYAASPYKTNATTWTYIPVADTQVRTAVHQLASDGLGAVFVDLLGACYLFNAVNGGCADLDAAHPGEPGHRFIADQFLSEMDNFQQPQAKQAARSAASDTVDIPFSSFMGLGSGTGASFFRINPTRDLLITQISLYQESQIQGCSVQPALLLCKGGCTVGTNAVVLLTVPNATGTIAPTPLEVTVPAGTVSWVQFQAGTGCTNAGSNFHLSLMFRMARD